MSVLGLTTRPARQPRPRRSRAIARFRTGDTDGAIALAEAALDERPRNLAALEMLGECHLRAGRYDEALTPIKTAIDMYRESGQAPKENWLLLLRVIYFEQKDYENMLEVVKELIAYYPKDTYVLTLAGIYSELGDTKKQLALTEVLYEKGYLNTTSHIVNLANLYLLHGLPYKAAVLLEKEMASDIVEGNERNLRLLSQAWYQAREDQKAIPPLERAADISKDGELYVRLAQAHINLENWRDASEAVREALRLGGLKRDDQANIMLGMALFNQKRLEQARRAFEVAQRDNRSRRAAEQWIAYVDSEIKRRDLLQQELPDAQPRERDELLDVIESQQ